MYRLTIIFILLLFPLMAVAQQADRESAGGSSYSSIGVGLPVDTHSSITSGMGLPGVSVFDSFSASSSNPALWGVSFHTQGNISAGLSNFQTSDGIETSRFNQLTVDQFQLVLPIIRQSLGVSIGFYPVTRSSFQLSSQGSIAPEPGSTPIQFLNNLDGSGGINKFEFGLGYRFGTNFAIGYAASVYLASIDRNFETFFDSPRFSTLEYTESYTGAALGNRFGIYGRLNDLLRSNDRISIGGALTLPVEIDIDREVTGYRFVGNQFSLVDLLPSTGVRNGNISLPLEYSAGITYQPSGQFNVTAEYTAQQWNDTDFSFHPSQEEYLVNRSRYGVGMQFHPYVVEGRESFLSNLRYSAGASYDTGHLNIDGHGIDTLMFHLGIGVLSQQAQSSIDISFQYGFRGTEAQNLIEERIWGIKLSLNLAEIMFVQQRFQ